MATEVHGGGSANLLSVSIPFSSIKARTIYASQYGVDGLSIVTQQGPTEGTYKYLTKSFSSDKTSMTLTCPTRYTPDRIHHAYCGGRRNADDNGVWELHSLGYCVPVAVGWWSERYLRILTDRYDFQFSSNGDICRYVQSSQSRLTYQWSGSISSEDCNTPSSKSIIVSWNQNYTSMTLTIAPNASRYYATAFNTSTSQSVSQFIWSRFTNVQCVFYE